HPDTLADGESRVARVLATRRRSAGHPAAYTGSVSRYYYAGGERVAIEPDEAQVAVDPGKIDADLRSAVQKAAGPSRLPGGLLLVPRSALDERSWQRLRDKCALRTVYRSGRALIVPLPEIRVEFDGATQRKAVEASIPKAPHPVR